MSDYLKNIGSSLGLTGWGDNRSNGTIYNNSNGGYNVSGMFTDRAATLQDMFANSDYAKAVDAKLFDGTQADFTAQSAAYNKANPGLTGMDILGGVQDAAQLGLGYLGYRDNKKMMNAQIKSYQDNLRMAEDQLYHDKDKGITKQDAVASSLGGAF